MSKGILCAIDFSDASKKVLRWSVDLAIKLNEPLTVIHAYRLLHRNGEAMEMKRRLESEAFQHFSILEKELLLGKGISYDFKNEVGFISDRVREHSKNNEVDFLVVGKNTNSDGNSISELVATTGVPLVVVP